jgi:hypothetical protein
MQQKAEFYPWFSACFGLFRSVSVSFGFTETPKLAVSI